MVHAALPAVAVSSRNCGLCFFDDDRESGRLADGTIGQDLAVHQDARLSKAVNKAAVGQSKRSHRCIEALNPERTEGAFPALTVAVRILVCFFDRLLRDPDGILAPAVETLRGLEHLLVLGMGGDAAFDACHDWSSFAARL